MRAATIILCVFRFIFIKRRKIESASEAIAFSKLRMIFKYGVTFCMTCFSVECISALRNRIAAWVGSFLVI